MQWRQAFRGRFQTEHRQPGPYRQRPTFAPPRKSQLQSTPLAVREPHRPAGLQAKLTRFGRTAPLKRVFPGEQFV
jgi:hypothetical protein